MRERQSNSLGPEKKTDSILKIQSRFTDVLASWMEFSQSELKSKIEQ